MRVHRRGRWTDLLNVDAVARAAKDERSAHGLGKPAGLAVLVDVSYSLESDLFVSTYLV